MKKLKWWLKYYLLKVIISKDEVIANLKPQHEDCLRWDGRTYFIINTALYGGIPDKKETKTSGNRTSTES